LAVFAVRHSAHMRSPMGYEGTETLNPGHRWHRVLMRYGAPFAVTAIALEVWFLWPVMHQDPFAIFLAAVIVCARFFGFGPAVVCTFLCCLTLDYMVFPPPGFGMSRNDSERMVVFVIVSLLTAGLARKRKQAETRAGEMRRRMAAIVESSEDAILSATPTGTITSWNRGAESLYGYSPREAIGRQISLLVRPDRAPEISRDIARIRRAEHVESYRTEHVRKDGTTATVLLSFSPIRNHAGGVVGFSAIARDFSAQQRTEEVLRRNEKLATAGRLAATIAHEISNPLESVTNLLYLARHDGKRIDEYLRLAEREVDRIGAIARQTLGFVREGPPASLNVAETMDQVLQLCLRRLESKHIEIEKEYEPGTNINGHAGELRQLFSNLVINAVDAMHECGKLRIHISRTRDWADGNRPGVRIIIADTGTGIQSNDFSHLFEPFYTTKKDLGTGLGLWISYGIVQKHGGRIRARSSTTPGRSGTVFSVFLPSAIENHKAA
jgi:PAS domain S-box-containing protein